MWLVKAVEIFFDLELYQYGIFPQDIKGLRGIIFSPFIHGSFSHLISNSIPLLVLGVALYYFYRDVAHKVFFLALIITGLWVWIVARPSFHIGASGILYSLAAFLFTSGVIRRHPRLMALSLLVAFLYGGMVWGVFPIKEGVSWESHLMGMISGVLLAFHFRRHGPQRKKYSWELEEEAEEEEDDEENHPEGPVWHRFEKEKGSGRETNPNATNAGKINYVFKSKPRGAGPD